MRANNYFARTDLQLNDRNFINARWLLEDAASRGEGFNTNDQAPDAKVFEEDHDTMWAGTYTSVLTDRLSSVTRFGRIGESLTTAPQGFFNDDGKAIGFDGRDPVSIGQRNQHPSYTTGTGGTGPTTVIRTYVDDQAISDFIPERRPHVVPLDLDQRREPERQSRADSQHDLRHRRQSRCGAVVAGRPSGAERAARRGDCRHRIQP